MVRLLRRCEKNNEFQNEVQTKSVKRDKRGTNLWECFLKVNRKREKQNLKGKLNNSSPCAIDFCEFLLRDTYFKNNGDCCKNIEKWDFNEIQENGYKRAQKK